MTESPTSVGLFCVVSHPVTCVNLSDMATGSCKVCDFLGQLSPEVSSLINKKILERTISADNAREAMRTLGHTVAASTIKRHRKENHALR